MTRGTLGWAGSNCCAAALIGVSFDMNAIVQRSDLELFINGNKDRNNPQYLARLTDVESIDVRD